MSKPADTGLQESAELSIQRLVEGTEHVDCLSCRCFRHALDVVLAHKPNVAKELFEAATSVRHLLITDQHDCLGCEPCLASDVMDAVGPNALYPAHIPEPRRGWPPLPGTYSMGRHAAPVAVCTLTDDALRQDLAERSHPAIAIVGSLQTENLGIEHIIVNTLANPNIRFLIVCGLDSRNAVGHLPGQSLVALAADGLDYEGRIVGARGKRPYIKNIDRVTVERFRRAITVVDLVGCQEIVHIEGIASECADSNPGPAEPREGVLHARVIRGRAAKRFSPDPSGYLALYVDRDRDLLALEHYTWEDTLDVIVEGKTASEVYTSAIEHQLLSTLDHAAYLGMELGRAETSLREGKPYTQDTSPWTAGEQVTPKRLPGCCGEGAETCAHGSS